MKYLKIFKMNFKVTKFYLHKMYLGNRICKRFVGIHPKFSPSFISAMDYQGIGFSVITFSIDSLWRKGGDVFDCVVLMCKI